MRRLKRLFWDITSKRFYTHNVRIYFTRIYYAILGERYTPMCCYTFSLDYSILKDIVDGLEYFLPHKFSVHVMTKEEIKELKELLKLGKYIIEEDTLTSFWNGWQKEFDRFFFLLHKYFRRLRI